MSLVHAFALALPGWVTALPLPTALPDLHDRMRLAIQLAQANITHRTGGPFGAAVFHAETHALVAVGVNVVVAGRCSSAHAEVMALSLAQAALGTHDLSAAGPFELVTSVAPCAMCYGATLWAGVRRLVCGARAEDAERIGFDEGPRPADWLGELRRRRIETLTDVEREAATAVLTAYAAQGGPIYNAGRP